MEASRMLQSFAQATDMYPIFLRVCIRSAMLGISFTVSLPLQTSKNSHTDLGAQPSMVLLDPEVCLLLWAHTVAPPSPLSCPLSMCTRHIFAAIVHLLSSMLAWKDDSILESVIVKGQGRPCSKVANFKARNESPTPSLLTPGAGQQRRHQK
jgi:hypothetical protein